MKQNKAKAFIFIGFIITAITLLIFYLVTYSSLKATVSQTKDEQLVLKMMRHLDNLQLCFSAIEATERPFLISIEKDKKIVTAFALAEINYKKEITELTGLLKYTSLPMSDIQQLIFLAEKKISFSEEIIFLSSHNKIQLAVSKLLNDEKNFDTPFTQQYNILSNKGRDLLRSFQEKHDADAEKTFDFFGLMGLIALSIMGFLFYKIWQRTKMVSTISEELQTANDQLKKHIDDQYSTLFENAKDVIGIVNDKGEILKVNSIIETMFGYTHAEVMKMNINDFLFPEDLIHAPFEFDKIPHNGSLLSEGRYKRKDGTKIYGEMKSSRLPDGTYMGIIRDITERKNNEKEIQKLASIIENSSALVGTMSLDMKITYINKAARKAIEIDEYADVSEMDALGFFASETNPPEAILNEVITNGDWQGENELITVSGKRIPILQYVQLHKNEKGEPSFISSNAIDLSALKEKEATVKKLAGIIENTQAYILIVDLNLNILYLNKAAKEKFGIGEDEDITRLSAMDFIPEETKAKMKIEEPKLLADGRWMGEVKYMNRKGEIFPVMEVALLNKDESDVVQYIALTLVDISDLKQKETELRNLTSIIENSPAFITMADMQKNYIYANASYREAFGIANDEDITKLNVSNFRGAATVEVIKNGSEENLSKGKWMGTNTFFARNGKEIPVLEVLVLHKNDKGQPERISFTAIDLTVQKHAEKELRRLNNELRELSIHLQNLIERERTNIAKEIHDQFGQNLTALSINAAWLKANITEKNKKIAEVLNEQISIAEDAIQSSRNLYNALHPNMLDEIGLEATIRWQIKILLKYSSIQAEIHSNVEEEKLSAEIRLGLFRIFQECITNVLRYSKATHLSVTIHKTDQSITMSIEDDGIGFDPDKIDMTRSHGLLGIRERVYALNGNSLIESSTGKGTKIEVSIPFVSEDETKGEYYI